MPVKEKTLRLEGFSNVVCSSLPRLFTNATKFVVEFLYTTGAINEAFLPCIGWVRIGGYVLNDHLILNTVDGFRFLGSNGGASQKFLSRRYVYKADGMGCGMDIGFHGSE